eukprot:gene9728-6816_t
MLFVFPLLLVLRPLVAATSLVSTSKRIVTRTNVVSPSHLE